MRALFAATALAMLLVAPEAATSQGLLDIEGGAASSGYNDVRIPGDDGTKISLVDDLSGGWEPFLRARASWTVGERHTISVLVAPLSLSVSGILPREVNFNGVEFPAGADVDASYRFDSYRLTYRYTIASGRRFEAGAGATAKIRDAEIRLTSETTSSSKKNTGFVPLVNFLIRWSFAPRLSLLLEGDALAAPQGRAEDVLLAALYRPSERFALKAGWRVVEGGADNDEVYTFALVNYAVFGMCVKF